MDAAERFMLSSPDSSLLILDKIHVRDLSGKESKARYALLTLAEFTRENVNAFLDWLQESTGNSNSTINLRLAALHSFARYLQYEEIDRLQQWQLILAIKKRKDERKSPAYLLVDGIKAILDQPDQSTRQGRRHLALLSLMYGTGARVQEIIDLKVESLQIQYEPFTIKITGKGIKTRIIPMLREQVALL